MLLQNYYNVTEILKLFMYLIWLEFNDLHDPKGIPSTSELKWTENMI